MPPETEPAGPNAIAANLASLTELADAGVPIVVIPLANPKAYRHNWRYPNTPERDWKKGGGYSVGDAEYLLPDLDAGTRPRADKVPGPETAALTQFVLRLTEQYPPRLVLDLHEGVRQYILMSEPAKPLCRPDCKGLCPECGNNLNQTTCSCDRTPIDPRLAALKDIKL